MDAERLQRDDQLEDLGASRDGKPSEMIYDAARSATWRTFARSKGGTNALKRTT